MHGQPHVTSLGGAHGSLVLLAITSLKLTAQCMAGWYRYIPVWEFFADGTLQGRFVATSVNNGCVAYTHHHHAYYRLDFDLNGTVNFTNNIGAQVGYRSFDVGYKFDNDDGSFVLKGLYFGIVARY